MAETLFQHGVGHRQHVILRHADDNVAGHDVAHRTAEDTLVVGCGAHDVALAQDAHQSPIGIGDDDGPDAMGYEQGHGLAHRLFGRNGDDPPALGCQNVTNFHRLASHRVVPAVRRQQVTWYGTQDVTQKGAKG